MAATPPVPRRPNRTRRAVTVGFVLVAVMAAGVVIWLRRDQVVEALSNLTPLPVLGSLVAATAGSYTTMLAWRTALADFGAPLPLGAAGRVFFLGQLGKYLPGSIWPVVAQMELGRGYGVRRSQSAAAATLLLVLAVTTGTALAVTILPLLVGGLLGRYAWVGLAAAPLLVLLIPGVQQWTARIAGRMLRRDVDLPRTTSRRMIVAAAWMLTSWLLFGLHLHLLVASTCACPQASLPLGIGVYALAWVAGFLGVIAPAGAGVRETVLVVGLAGALDPAAALLVALVSRLLVTVADLALAGVGVVAGRRRSSGVSP